MESADCSKRVLQHIKVVLIIWSPGVFTNETCGREMRRDFGPPSNPGRKKHKR